MQPDGAMIAGTIASAAMKPDTDPIVDLCAKRGSRYHSAGD
jgi:hypothetical protein